MNSRAVAQGGRPRAELFLESLQHRVYSSIGVTAEDCQQREWLGQQTILPLRLLQKAQELSPTEFARYRAAVFEALAQDESLPRPTPYERPHQYSILRGLKTAIESAASQLSIDLPVTPVIGTLPVRLLEPLMLRVPGSTDVVLVVDGSLLTYAHQLSKAVAQAVPFELLESEAFVPGPPAGEWYETIDPSGVAGEHFVELMLAALNGSASGAPSHAASPDSEPTAAALCECMELFIVAREYARLCEGDHVMARVEKRTVNGQGFEALAWTAEQEFRADGLGLALLLTAAHDKGESLRLAFWSADLLLSSLGLLERALQALDTPMAAPLAMFPPSVFDERRRRLYELMGSLEGGDRSVAFAEAMSPLFATLAERFEGALHELRFGAGPAH